MAAKQFTVEWIDRGREPQCEPDPDYPHGKFIPAFHGGPHCRVDLPYPAKRCGLYIVRCAKCSASVAITTAGRPDDPTGAMIGCDQAPIGAREQ